MAKNIIQVYTDTESDKKIREAAKACSQTLAGFCRRASIIEANKILRENPSEVQTNGN